MQHIRNWLAIGAIVIAYILQIYSDGLGATFRVGDVLIIVLNSLLLGIITFGGITLVIRILLRIRHNNNDDELAENLYKNIASDDLCRVCDDVTAELHQLITDSLPLPEFDSDLVEDMNQGITSSWLTPCTAFSYGIVAISMLKRDLNFLRTNNNRHLRNHVLEKMAKKMNETSLICKSEENTNLELVDEVTEDLKVIVRAVLHYFNSIKAKNNAPFSKLVDYLTMKVHRDLKQKLPEIEDIAEKMLIRVDNQIEKYGSLNAN